jgi:hypothetical protein
MLPDRNSPDRVHTVELLEQGIAALEALGYRTRIETELGRSLVCTIKSHPTLILDPSQPQRDQLDVVLDALCQEQHRLHVTLPVELQRVIEFQTKRRRAA